MANSDPVFIFSAGWRSGSTLLQRIAGSSGEIMMWGESRDGLGALADMYERYATNLASHTVNTAIGDGGCGLEQFDAFCSAPKDKRSQIWVANMNPPISGLLGGMRKMFESYYSVPAGKLGYARWGIKEVRCGRKVTDLLRALYPRSKFVFLIRNPFDCMLSIKRRNWIHLTDTKNPLSYFANTWVTLAREFRQIDYGLCVRYEDLRESPVVLDEIADYLEINSIPRDILTAGRPDWHAQNKASLSYLEKRHLLKIVKHEMREQGYTP